MSDLSPLLVGAKLLGIDVVRCFWERAHPSTTGPLTYPPLISQQLNITVRTPDPMPAGAASFLVVLQARWTPEGQPQDGLAAAEVQVRVAYAFADESLVIDQETAREFAQKIAQHHAWPYLRHRLQQLCLELGINPVLLPLKPLAGPDEPVPATAASP